MSFRNKEGAQTVMVSRQFSFRAWSEALQNFYYFSFPDRGPETTYKELPNRTVQQFTEMFDRNGVPIYEGDIVQRYPKEKYSPFTIRWSSDQGWDLPSSDPPSSNLVDFEIIGNAVQANCVRCGHTNPPNQDGSCSAYGYNGVDCQPQPCICRDHILSREVSGNE